MRPHLLETRLHDNAKVCTHSKKFLSQFSANPQTEFIQRKTRHFYGLQQGWPQQIWSGPVEPEL